MSKYVLSIKHLETFTNVTKFSKNRCIVVEGLLCLIIFLTSVWCEVRVLVSGSM